MPTEVISQLQCRQCASYSDYGYAAARRVSPASNRSILFTLLSRTANTTTERRGERMATVSTAGRPSIQFVRRKIPEEWRAESHHGLRCWSSASSSLIWIIFPFYWAFRNSHQPAIDTFGGKWDTVAAI